MRTAGLLLLLSIGAPAGAQTIFSDTFETGASPLWGNERGMWSASGGNYSASQPSNAPPTLSSLPHVVADFDLEIEVIDVVDGGIWLHLDEQAQNGVLLVTGGFGQTGTGFYWHVLENGTLGVQQNTTGPMFAQFDDLHLRITARGPVYSVYLNGSAQPATMLTLPSPRSGRIGLYDYHHPGQAFDNVVLTQQGECPRWLPTGASVFNDWVMALTALPGGNLIAGGAFTSVGGVAAAHIAAWDGSAWAPLAQGVSGDVWSLTVYNGDVIASGNFTSAGGQPASRIARWDGTAWTALGQGLASPASALAVANGELVAGGQSIYENKPLARWSGTGWSVFNYVALPPGVTASVRSLATVGGELFVGGRLHGIIHAAFVTGSTGTAMITGSDLWVAAIAPYGNEIAVGGQFSSSPSGPANNIFLWDGGQVFTPLGSGTSGRVSALEVYQGDLIAAGAFAMAGGQTVNNIARWTGTAWEPLGFGIGGVETSALCVHTGTLFAGGLFDTAGGLPAGNFASWGCPPPPPCYANCDGSTVQPVLNVDDFTCFINNFAAAQSLPHEQQIEHYANCDGSTVAPALNVDDFTCFINQFAAGCR